MCRQKSIIFVGKPINTTIDWLLSRTQSFTWARTEEVEE